ncbi:MAG TPA: sigma-70 family RNA polymerase sigma factor [Acidimicrobiales bacterium]|nr:sigma-70 family RNA polymerase sigma factor [Acidimicrobiales bacterium]
MTDDPPVAGPRRRDARDERLLDAARAGDHAAFTALLRRHDDQMRALAWSVLRDRTAMDDVLQDAYLKAYRNLDRFRGESRFSTWLHRIVYRTCLDHLRRRRPTTALDDVDPPAPGRLDSEADTRMAVERALADLDPETAAALILVDRDGHSYDEAGRILGIPAGTVASRLHRGRRSLRAVLEPTDTDRPEGDAR